MRHLVISNALVGADESLERFELLANKIIAEKPETIVNLGNFADLESLFYMYRPEKSRHQRDWPWYDGNAVAKDIETAQKALDILHAKLDRYNEIAEANGLEPYKPRIITLEGLHEKRLADALTHERNMLVSNFDILRAETGPLAFETKLPLDKFGTVVERVCEKLGDEDYRKVGEWRENTERCLNNFARTSRDEAVREIRPLLEALAGMKFEKGNFTHLKETLDACAEALKVQKEEQESLLKEARANMLESMPLAGDNKYRPALRTALDKAMEVTGEQTCGLINLVKGLSSSLESEFPLLCRYDFDSAENILGFSGKGHEIHKLESFDRLLPVNGKAEKIKGSFVEVDGICYTHMQPGKAGNDILQLESVMRRTKKSITVGNRFVRDQVSSTTPAGNVVTGLSVGCFVTPEKQAILARDGQFTEKAVWNGVVTKDILDNGDYDLTRTSLEDMKKYHEAGSILEFRHPELEDRPLRILLVPDAHVRTDIPNSRFDWLAKAILEHKPDVILNIGDWAEMASINPFVLYKNPLRREGVRYKEDVASANDAIDRVVKVLEDYNKMAEEQDLDPYVPRIVTMLGNHEGWLDKYLEKNPSLVGMISMKDINFEKFGPEVFDFRELLDINGVKYGHYVISGPMGRDVTTVKALLEMLGGSGVVGHRHTREYGEQRTQDGREIKGTFIGCFFDPEQKSEWAGAQVNNIYWSGLVLQENVKDGNYENRFLPAKGLQERYGQVPVLEDGLDEKTLSVIREENDLLKERLDDKSLARLRAKSDGRFDGVNDESLRELIRDDRARRAKGESGLPVPIYAL